MDPPLVKEEISVRGLFHKFLPIFAKVYQFTNFKNTQMTLLNKNFNHLIFLLKEIIKRFLSGKCNRLFGEVSPNICKNSFLNSPNFFPAKFLSRKVCRKFLRRSRQRRIQNPVKQLRYSFLRK